VYLKINGELFYLWRAVDQHGVVLDILVQERRSATAAKRFFNACWLASITNPTRSSRTGSATTVSRSARSCPVCGIRPAAT
jgi:transposase-like protein